MGAKSEAWRPVSQPPRDGKRILIRFFIREGRENVEYVLAGARKGHDWIVKAPWDARGLNVVHCVLATHWAPMPQERPISSRELLSPARHPARARRHRAENETHMMKSPEAEAGGGHVLPPADCARQAIIDCGGIEAAVAWCETWTHRPYFQEVRSELEKLR